MDFLSKTTLTIAIPILVFSFTSCQKDGQQETCKYKLSTEDDKKIKIRQAIFVYDADFDSIDYVQPQTSKRYDWKITPGNGCSSLSGAYTNGLARISFNCPGKYQVKAEIYESSTNKLIGTTDVMDVEVTKDTLFPAQPIYKDDNLIIRPGLVKSWTAPHNSSNAPPDEIYITLMLSTSKLYEYNPVYNSFEYTSALGNNSYSFIFSDSIKLNSYPFVSGIGFSNTVDGYIQLKELKMGVPANLSITWLDKTYTGTVTLINADQYSFDWNNTGAVKIN